MLGLLLRLMILFALQAGDGISTYLAIGKGATECNPLLGLFARKLGLVKSLIVLKGGVMACFTAAMLVTTSIRPSETRLWEAMLDVLNLIYLCAVAWNLHGLMKAG